MPLRVESFAVGYLSTEDPTFRSAVGQWLEQCGEVSALIRYSHAAGSKSFEFFHTMEAFSERLRQLPRRACVTVFRDRSYLYAVALMKSSGVRHWRIFPTAPSI